MRKLSISIFILAAAICIPFAVSAENEDVETSVTSEAVSETEIASEAESETELSDGAEEAEPEDVQDEDGTTEDVSGQETEDTDLQQEEDQPEEQLSEEELSESDFDLLAEPEDGMPEEDGEETNQETAEPEEDDFEIVENDEEKEKQQELDTARAESKNTADTTAPAANSIWIETIAHACKGHLLSAEKYGRFQGLTDFTFFTAQESGSYSAYSTGDGMVVLGKYQFTDFGQGNGTATALVAYMCANCSGDAWDLYDALYQTFVVEKKNAVSEWNECALNDTENFMAMQDQFAYEHYYARGEAAVEAAGISLQDRPWVVKGMCFSIFNALGPYNEYGSGAYVITTAGIEEKDSNAVFIEKICDNMVSLYADKYTWLSGRYGDGSGTAIGVSDKDLALEILSGSLFLEEEPVTDTLWKVSVKYDTEEDAPRIGIGARNICVTAKKVREYTNETEKKVLKPSKDYTISVKFNKKHTKLTFTIRGKGDYEGQVLKKKILLSAMQLKEQ